jgi:hypothetical protein
MHGRIGHLVLTGLLLLPGSAVLHAQSAAGDAGLQVSCMMWEGLPPEKLYFRNGESFTPLEFVPSKRSEAYRLNRSQAFEMFRKTAAPEDGEAVYQLVAKAPLIPGAERILFVVIQSKEQDLPEYKLFGIDDSLDSFPVGTFRFVNFSPSEVLVKFGGKTDKIPPRKMTVIESKVSPNGGFLPFLIADPKGKIIFETRVFGQPAGRELVFISPPARQGGPPRVKFLPQIIVPEPPDPAP